MNARECESKGVSVIEFSRISYPLGSDGSLGSKDGLLSRELVSTPSEVVKRWNQGDYLLRPIPSTGYRYCGLFIALSGYYHYTTSDREGNQTNQGIAHFFLEDGEIAFAAIRRKKMNREDEGRLLSKMRKRDGKLQPSSAKLRSLFTTFYQSPTGSRLCIVYSLISESTNEYTIPKCRSEREGVLYLKDCFSSFKRFSAIPYGVIELDVGKYENGVRQTPSSVDSFRATVKHLWTDERAQ